MWSPWQLQVRILSGHLLRNRHGAGLQRPALPVAEESSAQHFVECVCSCTASRTHGAWLVGVARAVQSDCRFGVHQVRILIAPLSSASTARGSIGSQASGHTSSDCSSLANSANDLDVDNVVRLDCRRRVHQIPDSTSGLRLPAFCHSSSSPFCPMSRRWLSTVCRADSGFGCSRPRAKASRRRLRGPPLSVAGALIRHGESAQCRTLAWRQRVVSAATAF